MTDSYQFRYFIALTSLAFPAFCVNQAFAEGSFQQPNVILVMTDDQGYGDLSCHGNTVLKTPNLDRLQSQSVRLTNFHTDPTCSPTRAALMTGRYSTRTGVWHTVMGRHMPRAEEVLMPAIFAAAGYRTAIFGKWHLGDNYPFRPQDRGFQEVLIHGGGGVGQIPDYWGNDYFDDTLFHNGQPKKFKGYCTDVFFQEAMNFIKANKKNPFFVYLSTNAPHGPYRVAEKYSRPFAGKVGGDADLARFYGMIANIDENVGKLLNLLDDLDLANNTIFIFMTDNGTARGAVFSDYRGNLGMLLRGFNAWMRGRKGSPYEGGHRVPCFIRWPAGKLPDAPKKGRDVDQLTAHLDLLPTLIDLCKLKQPAKVKFDGASLGPLLQGKVTNWPERTLFVHHQELPMPEKYRFCSVMTQNWRLVNSQFKDGQPLFELYDIKTDPGQKTDVSRKHPQVVEQLRGRYETWWKDISKNFDKPAEIVIGSDKQNPTHLTCFEWHSSRRWWQRAILRGFEDNGFWAIDVARAGDYEITLRRWPEELNKPITAAVPGGKAIQATTARLKISSADVTKKIPTGATAVTFRNKLKASKTRLQTWFLDNKGDSRGAYYVTVKRLP